MPIRLLANHPRLELCGIEHCATPSADAKGVLHTSLGQRPRYGATDDPSAKGAIHIRRGMVERCAQRTRHEMNCAFSACGSPYPIPGALPQADMNRAFGAGRAIQHENQPVLTKITYAPSRIHH